jgi:eukaryotic-like serine/threonine-protein kinase
MIDFLRSKSFPVQLAIILIMVALLLLGTYKWLNGYTNHGETVNVPDMKGRKYKDIEKFIEGKSIRVAVSDSTVFMLDKPPGIIVEQDPAPGEKVKENRTVYLTITRTVPPQVKLPNLVDVSKRQAEAILASFGLKIGKVTFKPDLAKDAVLAVQRNGVDLKPGQELSKGSTVDLVLGDGLGNTKVQVPALVGLTLDEALFVLQGSSLNTGALIFDESVRDSSMAVVYRQVPAVSSGAIIKQGESVDLYFTQSPNKLR